MPEYRTLYMVNREIISVARFEPAPAGGVAIGFVYADGEFHIVHDDVVFGMSDAVVLAVGKARELLYG